MQRVSLDQELRAKLNGLSQPLEVCDESGNPVGMFVPWADYQHMRYAAAEAACPFTDEQSAQFRKERGGRSLQEIMRDLGAA